MFFLPNAFLISSSVQSNGGPVKHKYLITSIIISARTWTTLGITLNIPQPTSKHGVVHQKAVQKVDSVFMHCGGDDITISKRIKYNSYNQLNKNKNITFKY